MNWKFEILANVTIWLGIVEPVYYDIYFDFIIIDVHLFLIR